jgi:NADH-quinone oxidoreductase subunit N
LTRDGKAMETMDDMAGLMRERPGMALAMTAFSVSAIGFPPFSGFWAKFYVFKAVLAAGYVDHSMPVALAVLVAVVGLVSSVVAAFYYLRLIKVMWFDPAPGAVDASPADAKGVAYAAALFSFPVVLVALVFLDPAARLAASAFGQG